jgi:transposase
MHSTKNAAIKNASTNDAATSNEVYDWHVGMDVHLKTTSLCILHGDGRRFKALTVKGHWFAAVAELRELLPTGRIAVCFEASCGSGALYDRLRVFAARVQAAHPGRLRLIFENKRKCDRVDAENLALLSYLGKVPSVHMPGIDVRSWRAMINHRARMVQERTRAKNTLRALLRGLAVEAPRGLWTKKGRAWLRELRFESAWDRLRRDQLLTRVDRLDADVRALEKELDLFAAKQPMVKRLMTAPGVGPRTAEAIAAWVDDPARFASGRIGAYLGLVPCMDSSAGRDRFGHITRQGPAVVRGLLAEAAWTAVRRSPKVKTYFERIRRGDKARTKIAIVATAHYLARCLLGMLRTGTDWREETAPTGPKATEAKPAA